MMTFKFYLASFIAIFFVSNGFAQKKQNVYFLKNNGRYVNQKDNANFIRVVQEPDSGSKLYNVLECYLNNNTKMMGKSITVIPLKLEGTVICYYPDKKKKQIATYENQHFSGPVYDYYPNGKLYRSIEYQSSESGKAANPFLIADEIVHVVNDSTGKETVKDGNGHYQLYNDDFHYIKEEGDIKNGKRDSVWKGFSPLGKLIYQENYAGGKFIRGSRVDEKGYTIKYTVKEALPTYDGGDYGFGKYLAQTMRYPLAAKQQGLEGTVVVGFLIDKTGVVSYVKILKSLSAEIDAMVVKTFKAAQKWKPSLQNGSPVPIESTLNVTFMIPDPHNFNIIISEISFSYPKTP